MNAKQTVPLLTALPAITAAAPPLLLGAGVVLGLIWLLSDDEKEKAPVPVESAATKPAPLAPVESKPTPTNPVAPVKHPVVAPNQPEPSAPMHFVKLARTAKKRITREDVAEALNYGAGKIPLGNAVLALQARGFGKTAAYKAFSSQGKFGDLIESMPDGLIEWKG